jgi:hypothetical protein
MQPRSVAQTLVNPGPEATTRPEESTQGAAGPEAGPVACRAASAEDSIRQGRACSVVSSPAPVADPTDFSSLLKLDPFEHGRLAIKLRSIYPRDPFSNADDLHRRSYTLFSPVLTARDILLGRGH